MLKAGGLRVKGGEVESCLGGLGGKGGKRGGPRGGGAHQRERSGGACWKRESGRLVAVSGGLLAVPPEETSRFQQCTASPCRLKPGWGVPGLSLSGDKKSLGD